ncbi:hypothetical protein M197_gp71 [Haloarcula hispanica tailed virus 2]|uniref:Uncharacterized protein n=1 Tax=Haloarcula hispanica tailed virus 2 TaxID=1273751 RepID=R4T8L6_9CAUD|nr:hypothetical protein M197_gp71 [Haloarcula hispanica tailed virus 2]AGM11235.1 hypothetical protein HHTV2_71 [Haloarcula hispanica tailed virus 2]
MTPEDLLVHALQVLQIVLWGFLLGFWGRHVYRAWQDGWRPSLPPYAPPDTPDSWRVLAALRLAPKPRLPCGCRAAWEDVNFNHDAEPDGTLRETIGDFRGCTREWDDVRMVEVDNGGVWVKHRHTPVHTHHECGRSWAEDLDDLYFTLETPEETRYDHPPDSSEMRALPDGWTRMNRGLAERAGQVSEYVYDVTWEAFVDVYDAAHDGNSYDPSKGTYCAVLLTGSPSSGLWERDEHYGDDRTGAAKPLMRSYNDGDYER